MLTNYTLLCTISNYGVTCKNNTGNEKLTHHIWCYNNHFKIITEYACQNVNQGYIGFLYNKLYTFDNNKI